MFTSLGILLRCMLIILRRIRHLPLNMPNTRSIHMRIELNIKFQWYSSLNNISLCPFNGASIHGRHMYTTSQTKAYGESFSASQIDRSQFSPTNLHRALLLPSLCQNPRIDICLKPRLTSWVNIMPCSCSGLQRGAMVQWWVCAIHQPPRPQMVCDSNFEILVRITSWRWWKAI